MPVASGKGHHTAISIRQQDAVLWVGRLAPDEKVTLPDNNYLHLYVAKGDAFLQDAGDLYSGDAVRLSLAGSPKLTAGKDGTEVLVWAMG